MLAFCKTSGHGDEKKEKKKKKMPILPQNLYPLHPT